MGPATECLTDIVRICAHVKAFTAKHAEINFRQRDAIDRVAIYVHQPWLALDDLSLAG